MKFYINTKQKEKSVEVLFKNVKNTRFEIDDKKEFLVFKKEDEKKVLGLREKIGGLRNIIRFARSQELEKININLKEIKNYFPFDNLEKNVEFVVTNFLMANYEFNKFKTKKKDTYDGVEEVNFVIEEGDKKEVEKGVAAGVVVGSSVNEARDLSNSPANVVNPITLGNYIKDRAKNFKEVKITILEEKDLVKIKAGGILAVSSGSEHEPRLIILEYWGKNKKDAPVALVGKGVTHDNGGINLKPSVGGSIEEMHLDMSGASAVIHAFFTLAEMKVKKNIVAVVPAVENSVSGKSYRPGDIITSLSEKTIEILNTDAEGRVILADALTYVQDKFKPEIILDVATLTGASIIALGTSASAVMSNNSELSKKILNLGNNVTGDFVWELPLWDDYKKAVKNKRADMGNLSESNARYGGSINGGIFLKEFINDETKWLHVDMAPRMTATPSDNLASGAMGETVRLFVEFVKNID